MAQDLWRASRIASQQHPSDYLRLPPMPLRVRQRQPGLRGGEARVPDLTLPEQLEKELRSDVYAAEEKGKTEKGR